jgi:hypothetical protein
MSALSRDRTCLFSSGLDGACHAGLTTEAIFGSRRKSLVAVTDADAQHCHTDARSGWLTY